MFCRNCGKALDNGMIVCPYCAVPVAGVGAAMQPESKEEISKSLLKIWVNGAVVFFLGIFGVHKFMEKKIGMGILYLFTFGLFGIGWLVDAIVALSKAIRETIDCFNK